VPAATCPGSCNTTYRKAAAAHTQALIAHDTAMAAWLAGPRTTPPPPRPQPPDLTAVPGDPIWCGRDTAHIRRSLAELDDLAARVAAEAEGLRAPRIDGQKVSGSRGTRTPSPLMDMVTDLAALLCDWEYTVKHRDTPARRGHLSTAITASVDQLLLNFTVAIGHPDFGADFGSEILLWHRKFITAGRAGTVRHSKRLPCTRCQRFSLTWTEGDAHVECRTPSCGRLMSLDEYSSYESVYPHMAAVF